MNFLTRHLNVGLQRMGRIIEGTLYPGPCKAHDVNAVRSQEGIG